MNPDLKKALTLDLISLLSVLKVYELLTEDYGWYTTLDTIINLPEYTR